MYSLSLQFSQPCRSHTSKPAAILHASRHPAPFLVYRPLHLPTAISRKCWRNKQTQLYSTVGESFETAQEAMNMLQNGHQSELVSLLPDELIDYCIAKKKEKLYVAYACHIHIQHEKPVRPTLYTTLYYCILTYYLPTYSPNCSSSNRTTSSTSTNSNQEVDLTFQEILDLCRPTDFRIDSYATRALLLDQPTKCQILSTLQLAEDKCLHRFAVTTPTGEHMCVLLDLQLQDTLEPKYRGVRCVKRWFLKSITGEAAEPIPNTAPPSPEFGPESVVQAQLDALQASNAVRVYEFASPANKEAIGSITEFAEMLRGGTFDYLLKHDFSEVLKSAQLSKDKCFVIIGVRKNGIKQVYCWVVGLQSRGDWKGCWMTDAVFPVTGESQLFM